MRKKELGRVAAGIKMSRRRDLLRRMGRVVKEGRGSGGRGACCDWCFFLPFEADKGGPEPVRNGLERVQRWSMCGRRPSGWGGAYRRIPPSCEC